MRKLLKYIRVQRQMLLVLSIALVARCLVLWLAVARQGVYWIYTRGVEVGFVAHSLLTGHGFASPFGGQTGPTALIAPGYPLLVAAVFKLFGIYSSTSAMLIMGAQVLLNMVTILLIMHLARALAGNRAALLAGIFWACWLPFLWMPTIFWETSLSACALPGVVLLAIRLDRKPTRLLWACFGVLCGLAALTNMALLITFGFILGWLALRSFRTQTLGIVTAALLFLITFSPWPIRNAKAFHTFIPLRTTVGLELWMGNHEGATGFLEESLFPIYNQHELGTYKRLGEVAYDKSKSAEARTWIEAHPRAFMNLTARRTLRFWAGSGSRNGSLVFVAGALCTSILGLWGLVLLYRSQARPIALLLALPLLLFPLPYYVTHAEFRYRLVIDPLLTVLAAYALTSMTRQHNASGKNELTSSIDRMQEHLVA